MRKIYLLVAVIYFLGFKAVSQQNINQNKYFKIAIAELTRHSKPEEIEADLIRYKEKGFTGIWFENDYLKWLLLQYLKMSHGT